MDDDAQIIGQPSFDPGRSGRRYHGIKRSRRFWFLVAAAILLAVGFVVAQRLAASWTPAAKAKEKPVEVSKAQPAVYKVDPPTATVVPVNLPVHPPEPIQVQAAPPMPQTPAPAPASVQPPVRQAPARAKQLPTEIAWNVQVKGEPPADWFADGRRPTIAYGCTIQPGLSLIPAVLNTVVQSEVAGQVFATVSEDVYDADGTRLPGRDEPLIPQGAKMVGIYKSDLTLGSRRLGIVWTQVGWPGKQLALADSSGMDVAGSMGVGGTVTTAWGQVIATAALFSIFDVAQRAFIEGDDYASELGASAANQFSRTGQKVIGQMLEQAVKIRIPAGTQVVAMPGKTIQVC